MSRRSVAKNSPLTQASQHDLSPRVALYMRVSSDEQAEEGTIEVQQRFLRQFTQLYQMSVADAYADDGVSGKLPLSERPEGRRLLQDAEAGRFGVVLVYRIKRFGRSLKAIMDSYYALEQYAAEYNHPRFGLPLPAGERGRETRTRGSFTTLPGGRHATQTSREPGGCRRAPPGHA